MKDRRKERGSKEKDRDGWKIEEKREGVRRRIGMDER